MKGFVVGDVWGRNSLRVAFRFHWVLEGSVLNSNLRDLKRRILAHHMELTPRELDLNVSGVTKFILGEFVESTWNLYVLEFESKFLSGDLQISNPTPFRW